MESYAKPKSIAPRLFDLFIIFVTVKAINKRNKLEN